MKSKTNTIKEFFFTIFVMLLFTWVLFVFVTFLSVYHAAAQIRQPNQQEFMRVRLYGSSSTADGNTISASFKIMDTAGNEIAGLAMYNAGTVKVRRNSTPQITLNYISQIEHYKAALEENFESEVISFFEDGGLKKLAMR